MMQQGLDLSRKPHIVISTPGRLADHIDSGTDFSLKRIKFLVSFYIYKLIKIFYYDFFCCHIQDLDYHQ